MNDKAVLYTVEDNCTVISSQFPKQEFKKDMLDRMSERFDLLLNMQFWWSLLRQYKLMNYYGTEHSNNSLCEIINGIVSRERAICSN